MASFSTLLLETRMQTLYSPQGQAATAVRPIPRHQQQQPNSWSSKHKHKRIKLSDNNLTATGNSSVRAVHPIPPDGNYFFEVKWLKSLGVIGLAPAAMSMSE